MRDLVISYRSGEKVVLRNEYIIVDNQFVEKNQYFIDLVSNILSNQIKKVEV